MPVSPDLTDPALAAAVGGLLLTAVLLLWRRSLQGSIGLLAIQGVALGGLALTIAAVESEAALAWMVLPILAIKAIGIPWLLAWTARRVQADREGAPTVNPTSGLLWAAALTALAYVVARPLVGEHAEATQQAVPVGLAMVLIGFLILLTRRQAVSQLVGFLVLDNGIATTALLLAGGLPAVIEIGVLLDVLLVVLVLAVLMGRLHSVLGGTDMDELKELRD